MSNEREAIHAAVRATLDENPIATVTRAQARWLLVEKEGVERALAHEREKNARLREEWRLEKEAKDAALASLRMVQHPDVDDVWFWQGSGDEPESLTCPVIMSADTLRGFLEHIAERDELLAKVKRHDAEKEALRRECALENHLEREAWAKAFAVLTGKTEDRKHSADEILSAARLAAVERAEWARMCKGAQTERDRATKNNEVLHAHCEQLVARMKDHVERDVYDAVLKDRNEMHRRAQAYEGAAMRLRRVREGFERQLERVRAGARAKGVTWRKFYSAAVGQLWAADVPTDCDGYSPHVREGRLDVLITRLIAQRDEAWRAFDEACMAFAGQSLALDVWRRAHKDMLEQSDDWRQRAWKRYAELAELTKERDAIRARVDYALSIVNAYGCLNCVYSCETHRDGRTESRCLACRIEAALTKGGGT